MYIVIYALDGCVSYNLSSVHGKESFKRMLFYLLSFLYRYLNYVPGGNRVSRIYNVQDILWFQCMVHVM